MEESQKPLHRPALPPNQRINQQQVPSNYVAGIGRGATGFTTRSDIGPARDFEFGKPPEGYIAGRGRGMGVLNATGRIPSSDSTTTSAVQESDDSEAVGNTNQFDNWSGGFGDQLFSNTNYDQEDVDADAVWNKIDQSMDQRRKRRREEKEKQLLEKFRDATPKLQSIFADLKSDLGTITEDQWKSIPDIGNYNIKRQKLNIYRPVPDSLLERAKQEQEYSSSISDASVSGTVTDLKAYGEARETIIKNQLKKVEDSITGKTTIDPKHYMSHLQNSSIQSNSIYGAVGNIDIDNLNRARELYKNATIANPKNGPLWISRARVEELAGKMTAARNIISQGCDSCPESEDVWIEAARLHTPDIAKAILAEAVKHCPKSVNIWFAAANLETNAKTKKKVFRRALEVIPQSVKLWKEAVNLEEEEEDAKILLGRAVECIPESVELWLALAKLESYENAKKVLNSARKKLTTEPLIWIAAAELEEAQHNKTVSQIQSLLEKGIKALQSYQVVIKRDDWIKYAFMAEDSDHPITCEAIIKCVIQLDIDQQDWKKVWLQDAEHCLDASFLHEFYGKNRRVKVATARAIYHHALAVFPSKKSIWRRAAELEREYGTTESLFEVLRNAVKQCPQSESLWLLLIRELWARKQFDEAQTTLQEAFKVNQTSDALWLAAAKLELDRQNVSRAREILKEAREKANTCGTWLKSAIFERNLNQFEEEKSLLQEALSRFPNEEKLWLMKAQNELRLDIPTDGTLQEALQYCPKSVAIRLLMAKLEIQHNNFTKARAIMERARLDIPQIQELWLASVRIERLAKNENAIQSIMARALQECPKSGILWAESIAIETKAKQRARANLALETCDKDATVLTAATQIFVQERKYDKARIWFSKAILLNKDYGDAWLHLYWFEVQHGNQEQQQKVIRNCLQANPHHGELWTLISKEMYENYYASPEEILLKSTSLMEKLQKEILITTYVSPETKAQLTASTT